MSLLITRGLGNNHLLTTRGLGLADRYEAEFGTGGYILHPVHPRMKITRIYNYDCKVPIFLDEKHIIDCKIPIKINHSKDYKIGIPLSITQEQNYNVKIRLDHKLLKTILELT